jgi:hypothetical protein
VKREQSRKRAVLDKSYRDVIRGQSTLRRKMLHPWKLCPKPNCAVSRMSAEGKLALAHVFQN